MLSITLGAKGEEGEGPSQELLALCTHCPPHPAHCPAQRGAPSTTRNQRLAAGPPAKTCLDARSFPGDKALNLGVTQHGLNMRRAPAPFLFCGAQSQPSPPGCSGLRIFSGWSLGCTDSSSGATLHAGPTGFFCGVGWSPTQSLMLDTMSWGCSHTRCSGVF